MVAQLTPKAIMAQSTREIHFSSRPKKRHSLYMSSMLTAMMAAVTTKKVIMAHFIPFPVNQGETPLIYPITQQYCSVFKGELQVYENV